MILINLTLSKKMPIGEIALNCFLNRNIPAELIPPRQLARMNILQFFKILKVTILCHLIQD